MKTICFALVFGASLAGLAQTPPPAPPPTAPAPASVSAAQPPTMVEAPTRKKPYIIEGKMSATIDMPSYTQAAGGAKSQGDLLSAGLEGGSKGGGSRKKGGDGEGSGPGMSSNRNYSIQVPPGAKLKVQLQCRRLRNFKVHFISDTLGRTEDPGLFINKLHHRDDAAFYENKTDKVRTINCRLVGVESMENEPFTLIFTDY